MDKILHFETDFLRLDVNKITFEGFHMENGLCKLINVKIKDGIYL